MTRRLQLEPPANWQDFEDLCLALWRRVWNDPNAQKHGRSGQRQAGVDISGRPNDREQWAGIQCKVVYGMMTVRHIREEVEKAYFFQPQLSHFIIATTARRDATDKAAARAYSEELLRAGHFSVNVVCWDDIVELLYEHPDVISVFYPISRSQVEKELARPGTQSALTIDDAIRHGYNPIIWQLAFCFTDNDTRNSVSLDFSESLCLTIHETHTHVSHIMIQANKDNAYLKELFEAGKLKPVIDKCFSLEETADAFRYFGEGNFKGKVVITVEHTHKTYTAHPADAEARRYLLDVPGIEY